MVEFLNEKIKYLRTISALTQTELAEKIGIATNTLCQYEKNKANPSLEVVLQIAKFFGVSTDYLLGLEDDFGAKTGNIAGNGGYSAEEKALIEDYRALSPGLKDMLKDTLDVWLRSDVNSSIKNQG